jgi:tetratricopeptide (TPR) repeat protein
MRSSHTGEGIDLADRATELAQLHGIYREIVGGPGDRRGRLVSLTGERGVGKTALALAFLRRIKAADPLAIALTARCIEGQSRYRPYGPFRDLLAQLRALGGDQGVAAMVGREAPGWLPQAPQSAGRNALFDQYLSLCRAIARVRPLVLLIDDLQWSDRSSLDLLGRLGSALASTPVLIVVTHEEDPSENALSIRGLLNRVGPNSVELVVRGLERDVVLTIAEGILGTIGGELGDWLVGAAQGRPLRVDHLVRLLLEERIVRKRMLRYKVRTEALPSPAERIEAIVLRRLDGLEPKLRWTLEAAALAGSVIDSAVVAGQVGVPEQEVLAQLRAAEERYGLIDGVGDRRWANGRWSVRFHFRHPIVRRVLRQRVPEKRRRHLLVRAAEVLEELAGDGRGEIAGEIAALLIAAEVPDRAREWFQRAADLAERLYALYEVEEFLRMAARQTGDARERLLIESRLARIYGATGREPEAEALAEEVYRRAGELGEAGIEVSAGAMLGWLRIDRGDPPQKLGQLAVSLVDKARAAESPEKLVMALDLSCVVAERLGRAEEALLMAEEALHVAEQTGDPQIVAQAAYRLARVHVSWGSPPEGRALAERALDVFAQVDDLAGVAVCHDLLGLASFRAGDWDGALHHWGLALESVELAGVPEQKIAMQVSIAELLTLRGEFDRARALFKSGLELAEELDDQALTLRCRVGIARMEFERGDYPTVLEHTEAIRELLPESGAWREDFQTTTIRALAYLELGDELQAWQEAARLERLYQGKEGWFERRAEGDAVRIRVIDLDSDAWLAGAVARQGIGETADKDPYGEGFLQYHRACVLARAQPEEARQAAERAVELFARLGAEPMLKRAKQLRDTLPTPEALAEEGEWGGEEDQTDDWFRSFEG